MLHVQCRHFCQWWAVGNHKSIDRSINHQSINLYCKIQLSECNWDNMESDSPKNPKRDNIVLRNRRCKSVNSLYNVQYSITNPRQKAVSQVSTQSNKLNTFTTHISLKHRACSKSCFQPKILTSNHQYVDVSSTDYWPRQTFASFQQVR